MPPIRSQLQGNSNTSSGRPTTKSLDFLKGDSTFFVYMCELVFVQSIVFSPNPPSWGHLDPSLILSFFRRLLGPFFWGFWGLFQGPNHATNQTFPWSVFQLVLEQFSVFGVSFGVRFRVIWRSWGASRPSGNVYFVLNFIEFHGLRPRKMGSRWCFGRSLVSGPSFC